MVFRIVLLSVVAAVFLMGSSAYAIEEAKPEESQKIKSKVTVMEEAKTLRGRLEENGITFDAEYVFDAYGLLSGEEPQHPVKYMQKFHTGVTLDTEKAGLYKGGEFHVNFETLQGRTLTESYIGDIQAYNNNDAGEYGQLNEYFYKHSLFGDKVKLKLGRSDANDDFISLDSTGNFVHSSLALIPNIPIPTYPAPALGAAVFYSPFENIDLKYGIYDSAAKTKTNGTRTAFHSGNSAVHISELRYRPEINNHKGQYLVGHWYNTANTDEVGVEEPYAYQGNSGYYTSFEQEIFLEKDKEQGLSFVGQFGWAPQKKNDISRYYGTGLVYKGLFPSRESDETGFAVAIADLSQRLKHAEDRRYEAAYELYYKLQLNNWCAIQPDIQFIANPDGNRENALLFGIRTIISL